MAARRQVAQPAAERAGGVRRRGVRRRGGHCRGAPGAARRSPEARELGRCSTAFASERLVTALAPPRRWRRRPRAVCARTWPRQWQHRAPRQPRVRLRAFARALALSAGDGRGSVGALDRRRAHLAARKRIAQPLLASARRLLRKWSLRDRSFAARERTRAACAARSVAHNARRRSSAPLAAPRWRVFNSTRTQRSSTSSASAAAATTTSRRCRRARGGPQLVLERELSIPSFRNRRHRPRCCGASATPP